MAKYYPDIAKGAKGIKETLFFFALVALVLYNRAERSIGFDLSLTDHKCNALDTSSNKTDLLTGSLTYENKFSLDAKPIEGGVRT